MNLKKLVKFGFGKIEAIKSIKSAGVAGTGAVVFSAIGDLLPAPLNDPIIGIPLLTWAVNTIRKFVTNNEKSE